jgi:site-specific DNA-methyltransferase (adenine-specific)
MNIDACRIPLQETGEDKRLGGKGNWKTDKSAKDIYEGGYKGEEIYSSELGRFPANMIFDIYMGEVLDSQSGISKSTGGSGEKSRGALGNSVYGKYENKEISTNAGGLGDEGGASRYFLKIDEEDFVPFLYCAKPSKKEKGECNSHVTVKPKELIKWLIKLVTPVGGKTIDITSGSGTHAVACEELNRDENYGLRWIDVEMLNTEAEPYCEIAKKRILYIIENNEKSAVGDD